MKPFWGGIIISALSAAPAAAQDGAFTFGPAERLLLQRNTMANVAIGDFNGDGRNDLAATMRGDTWIHSLYVYLQRTDGSLPVPLVVALPHAYGTDQGFPVSAVDLDRDGIDELVFGSSNRGLGIVHYDGTALLPMRVVDSEFGCQYQAIGDIDADGHMDVACHDWKFTATLYFGDGEGGFEIQSWRTSFGAWDPYYHFKSMTLVDVTGDGRLDLVGTDSTINSFFVYENAGGRKFLAGRAYPHPASPTRTWSAGLTALDLGSDGTLEVVTASPENQPDGAFNVHRRQPSGFLARTERLPSFDSATALHAVDVDLDDAQELVAGHYKFNSVTVTYQAAGKLARTDRFELPGFVGHNHTMAVGDLDSDGCPDLVAGAYSGLFLLRGCASPRWTRPRYDLDGDGVSDLVIAVNAGTPAYNQIWRWAQIEAFWVNPNAEDTPYIPGKIEVQAWGDFDGDGGSDLFVRDLESGVNRMLLNAQHLRGSSSLPDQAWQVVGAGEFNGDDRSDLVWRNSTTGNNVLWLSGDSATQKALNRLPDVRWKVAGIGDFDGNGRSDILWRHAGGSNMVWFDGRRALQRSLRTIHPRWEVVGIGDFDGDWVDDVAWRSAALKRNTIWRGANAATQIPVRQRDASWNVAIVGDYNGDGEDDLVWHEPTTGTLQIWRSGDANRVQVVASIAPYRWVVR